MTQFWIWIWRRLVPSVAWVLKPHNRHLRSGRIGVLRSSASRLACVAQPSAWRVSHRRPGQRAVLHATLNALRRERSPCQHLTDP
eukprot:scaffold13793_cov93-Phaeocystis_antarctica.AAC.1